MATTKLRNVRSGLGFSLCASKRLTTSSCMSLPYLHRLLASHGGFSRRVFLCRGSRCSSSGRYLRKYSTKPALQKQRPLRLGIVGSGPAGFYAAGRVIEKLQDAVVDMYEQLPVPFGLVRFGVAPDHPEVKNCQDKFEDTASSSRFNFVGNIDLGKDLPLNYIKQHYDALLFAYGASEDKVLGIPGEDSPSLYSARAFVGWYNGLPEYAKYAPRLDNGEVAIIVGQGNVALDVARFLLSDVDALRKTDVTDEALETLSKSRIKHVSIIGRRGPIQAAFSIKELRELMKLPSVGFEQFDLNLLPLHDMKILPRPKRRIASLMAEGSANDQSQAAKAWRLQFLLSPESLNPTSATQPDLASVSFARNAFAEGSDGFDSSAKVVRTHESTTIPASHAFRSIGYKSAALPGLTTELGVPFNERAGVIPNDPWGRVVANIDESGEAASNPVGGMYCAGWVKRGPTGVIASTMEDAFATADSIVKDWTSSATFMNGSRGINGGGEGTGLGWEGVSAQAEAQGLRRTTWEDWKRIDAAEKERGRAKGKPREKFRSIAEMLQVLDS